MVQKMQPMRGAFAIGNDFPFASADLVLPPDISDHDPNAFYYKGGRSSVPEASIQLTCDQWRHGQDAAHFNVEVHVEIKDGEFLGQVECVVHCSNLATPIRSFVSITVAVTAGDTKAHAIEMIDQLRRSTSE